MVLEQPNRQHSQRQQERVQQQIQAVDAMHEIRLGVQFNVGGLGITQQPRMIAQKDGPDQEQRPHWVHAP